MSENKSFVAISDKPRFTFLCNNCGFTGKTSGSMKMKCPKCGLDVFKNEHEDSEENAKILAEDFEEVKS